MSVAGEHSQKNEAADAEKVNQAERSVQSRSVDGVESLLLDVIHPSSVRR